MLQLGVLHPLLQLLKDSSKGEGAGVLDLNLSAVTCHAAAPAPAPVLPLCHARPPMHGVLRWGVLSVPAVD